MIPEIARSIYAFSLQILTIVKMTGDSFVACFHRARVRHMPSKHMSANDSKWNPSMILIIIFQIFYT